MIVVNYPFPETSIFKLSCLVVASSVVQVSGSALLHRGVALRRELRTLTGWLVFCLGFVATVSLVVTCPSAIR